MKSKHLPISEIDLIANIFSLAKIIRLHTFYKQQTVLGISICVQMCWFITRREVNKFEMYLLDTNTNCV